MNIQNKIIILVAGHFPPPVNGLSYITAEISKLFSVTHDVVAIDIAPHVDTNVLPCCVQRLLSTLKGVAKIVSYMNVVGRCFYMTCDSGLGRIYNIILVLFARLLRYPIYIHYHSFNFIYKYSLLQHCLLRIIGNNSTHIFLCPAMAARFSEQYHRTLNAYILSNSAFVDVRISCISEWTQERPLTIGLLSNLNDDKGLSIFLVLLKRAVAEGMNLRGLLAGPPLNATDRINIDTAVNELGEKLRYLGPVYGIAKASFFQAIDVFVFPTCYKNEAQPTVIFEAMSYGVPIVTYERGCIKDQVNMAGVVLAQGEGFIQATLDWLKVQMANPSAFHELKRASRATFLQDRSHARDAAASLIRLH